jgi:hypothetical protein
MALEDGEEIRARAVVSNMYFRRTFVDAMDPKDLP